MPAIARDSLMSLEQYARERPQFRARVIAHKRERTLHLGEHVTLVFEDELTIRYQVQEMLRIERTFEEAGILDELGAYNPLIPDGSNFKATMLIEYPDEQQRKQNLARLIGIEDKVWVQVDGLCEGLRDRGRGSRARERGEDLGGAFPALRTDCRNETRACRGRCAVGRRRSSALQCGRDACAGSVAYLAVR